MNTKKQIVIFLGPPGCGKGSLSNLCVKKLGWSQLSTGNLCREHIANNTEIGQKIDFNIKSGKLISDDLIIGMVSQWLIDNYKEQNGIILDGFPRTISQAISLYELLLSPDLSDINFYVIKILVSDKSVTNRMVQRTICKSSTCQAVYSLTQGSKLKPTKYMVCDDCGSELVRRADDEIEAIKERLSLYRKHEKELINFYLNKKILIHELMGEESLENVYKQLIAVLGIKLDDNY